MILLLAFACGPKIPGPPRSAAASLPVDRASLPELSVRALEIARFRMPDRQARANGDRDLVQQAPLHAYLVTHPTHGPILIDVGYGRRTQNDPNDFPGRTAVRLLRIEMGAPVVDQLGAVGLAADDITHVVLTHLHHDHVGGLEDLPRATVHADADEWSWGRRKRALRGVDPLPYAGRENTPIPWVNEAYGPFPSHADLFGDGTFVLLPAPGHTPGSLMVLVHGRDRSWLFTGDAAWIDANWQVPTPKGWAPRALVEVDWREGMDALWRIHALSSLPDLTIVSGHEPANLERLAGWPDPVEAW